MKILLVSDTYHPESNAGAKMMAELNDYLSKYHDVTVMAGGLTDTKSDNVLIIRKSKPKSNLYRFFCEMKFAIDLIRCRDPQSQFDVVFWYSPSIFIAVFVGLCFRRARKIMLLRDLFPLWLEQDLKLNFGVKRFVLRAFERYQYFVADQILVQSPGDISQLRARKVTNKIQVIRNWYASNDQCELNPTREKIVTTPEFIRLIYAGNAGQAQNLYENLSKLSGFLAVENIRANLDIYSQTTEDFQKLSTSFLKIRQFRPFKNNLTSRVYAKYDFGLVSLKSNLLTNNIPGKYVSYIAHGLPVISFSSNQIDLFDEIRLSEIGLAISASDISENNMIKDLCNDYRAASQRALDLYNNLYSPEKILPRIREIIEDE